jgi:predicted hydrocarbon binding protein
MMTKLTHPLAHFAARIYPADAFPEDPAALNAALVARYGVQAAWQFGRAWFQADIVARGSAISIREMAYHTLPIGARLVAALPPLLHLLDERLGEQRMTVLDRGSYVLVRCGESLFVQSQRRPQTFCHILRGILYQGVQYLIDTPFCWVMETSCRTSGDAACVFQIGAEA